MLAMSTYDASRERVGEVSEAPPLDTQTATPPPVPPRRPIVGLAIMDDANERFQQLERILLEAQKPTKAALGMLRERLDK